MLSVSGLRGLVGQSLTPPVAARYAAAFGQWLKVQTGESGPHVVIGRDSRPSGQMIELAAASGLIAVGCRVTRLGIATTPGTAIMVQHLQAQGGMVITASHNPILWNGLKALRHDGVAPPPEEAADIIRRFHEDDVSFAAVEALQALVDNDETIRVHVDRVLAQVNVAAIRAARLKVVLDSVHGAGGPVARALLDALGVELVHLFAEPTGHFPHTPEPTRENLTGLCAAMRQQRADVGFAQDPDADRLAIVDECGTYIGEEYTLALAALHVLEHRPGRAVLAANLSTSRMIDDIAAGHGATVVRTPVGEASVAAAMRSHDALIGGEGNGGVIFPPVIHVRDSVAGMALILELLATRRQPLSAIVAGVPRYAIVKDKLPVTPAIVARFRDVMRRHFAGQRLDEQDGVRVDWPDRWVHVRASNTEPIVRIIAEAGDEGSARELVRQVREVLGVTA